jgi:hypothetical protein
MRHLLPAVLLACALGAPAYAAEPAPPAPGKKLCQQDPAKCEEMKARRREFCKENPQTCQMRKHLRAERKEYCRDNPEKCQKVKEERHERMERREEKRETFCKQHPDQCPNRHDDEEQPHPQPQGQSTERSGPPR